MQETPSGPSPFSIRRTTCFRKGYRGTAHLSETRYLCRQDHSIVARLRLADRLSGVESFLPAVMGERFVGFRHFVRVVALLHRVATVLSGVDELRGKTLFHRL